MRKLGLTSGALSRRLNSIDFQFSLFEKTNLASSMCERYKFELSDAAKSSLSRGEDIRLDDLGNYKLIKRARPISVIDHGDGNYGSIGFSYTGSITGCSMTSDETRLFLSGQLPGSIETHETIPFAGSF